MGSDFQDQIARLPDCPQSAGSPVGQWSSRGARVAVAGLLQVDGAGLWAEVAEATGTRESEKTITHT